MTAPASHAPADADVHDGTVARIVTHQEFVFADCLVVGGEVYEYGWAGDRLVLGPALSIDPGRHALAGFVEHDRKDLDGVCYSCGGTSASALSGYFMKTVGDRLAWLLVCTSSEPFTQVGRRRGGVELVSTLGERWVLPSEDVTAVHVVSPPY